MRNNLERFLDNGRKFYWTELLIWKFLCLASHKRLIALGPIKLLLLTLSEWLD